MWQAQEPALPAPATVPCSARTARPAAAPTPAPTPQATPACGAAPAGGFPVLFHTHNHGPQSTGNYAHFNIAVVDALVGNTGWMSGNFKLKNVRTGVIGNAVLWRSHNRPNGGADEGHLRWVRAAASVVPAMPRGRSHRSYQRPTLKPHPPSPLVF